ncbi:hypothetical protein CECT5772_05648 [Streptococcus equi subsp. ruminatorum CECT 5772]|uniref:Uncharacterized protein n=1 Tax=Streptococcus equi subsp. ruminatorum CECT 5772 TaxID=1051981 RepID=A0A922T679_9STRE|nr:hypothetical protein [Streptococcus equi]KED04377.1 hypothetical protein CECT5772_05648 [Streptococcus equi subsp. ruminatorum CECT 5772]
MLLILIVVWSYQLLWTSLLLLLMLALHHYIQVDKKTFIKNNKAIRKMTPFLEWLVRLADREKVNNSEVLTKALERK